jgi:spermidine synthase
VDRIDLENNSKVRMIAVNGKIVASDNPADMAVQLLLGHVPVLLHPDPKSVLVIGYGAGVTMGSISTYAGVEKMTLVDIEPAVLASAPFFNHINEEVLDDPRLTVVIQDGRNFLKTTTEKFDVITADPVHPWAAGSAYLFTTDYYKQASLRLKEGGVMVQWVPITGLSVDNVKSIAASFSQNFTKVSIWRTHVDVVLVGTNGPMNLSMERLTERIAEPSVNRQLDWVNLGEPMKFMARLELENEGVRIFNEGANINTDDNLYLEFSSPLAMGEMCDLTNVCGMKSWYPPRIRMMDTWLPFAESNSEARDILLRHKEEQGPRWMSIPKQKPQPTLSPDS